MAIKWVSSLVIGVIIFIDSLNIVAKRRCWERNSVFILYRLQIIYCYIKTEDLAKFSCIARSCLELGDALVWWWADQFFHTYSITFNEIRAITHHWLPRIQEWCAYLRQRWRWLCYQFLCLFVPLLAGQFKKLSTIFVYIFLYRWYVWLATAD